GSLNALCELRKLRLSRTFDYVRHYSEYYEILLAKTRYKETVDSNQLLQALPEMDRVTLMNNFSRVVSTEGKPRFFLNTGGTGGRELEIPIYFEEQECRSLLSTISALSGESKDNPTCILHLVDPWHGAAGGAIGASTSFNSIFER